MAREKTQYMSLEEDILKGLASFGFALGNLTGLEKSIYFTPENLIIDIIKYSQKPRNFYGGIPILIAKNKIDYKRLAQMAVVNDVAAQTGLMLEYSLLSIKKVDPDYVNDDMESAIKELEKYTPKTEILLNKNFTGTTYKDSAKERLNELGLQRWNVIAKPDLEGTLDYMEQYNAR